MFVAFPNLETAQQHAQAHSLRQRVCVYIVRGLELLVFEHTPEHPTAGVQVPAGGLEPTETILEGALREGFEESGLTDLHNPEYLGSGLLENGMVQQVWHFVWVKTVNTRAAWEHLAEGQYTFLHRFEPLETVQLHYSMDALLPKLWAALGYTVIEKAVCYVTREKNNQQELLVLNGHKDGGVQVPRGTLEHPETPFEAAKRELLEESGLDINDGIFLGNNAFILARTVADKYPSDHPKQKQVWYYHQYQFIASESTADAWTHQVSAGTSDLTREYHYQFMTLEQVNLPYGMNTGTDALLSINSRMSKRPCVICYITRGSEILTFSGHPDGGIGVPAGGIEEGETPPEAAIREILEESGLSLETFVYLGQQEYYFKGQHPENGLPLEFWEDRYYYAFETLEPRDSWDWVVSDGVGDKGRVFQHSFVPLEGVQIDWDMGEFLPLLKESNEHDF